MQKYTYRKSYSDAKHIVLTSVECIMKLLHIKRLPRSKFFYGDVTEALVVQECKLVIQQQVGQCNLSFGATSCFVIQSCVLSTSASPPRIALAKTEQRQELPGFGGGTQTRAVLHCTRSKGGSKLSKSLHSNVISEARL